MTSVSVVNVNGSSLVMWMQTNLFHARWEKIATKSSCLIHVFGIAITFFVAHPPFVAREGIQDGR